jgi:integrase/recombinase XerD
MFRHSVAMALLQSGVHIEIIALYLGHEHVQTTRVYVEADLAMKEQTLKKIVPTLAPPQRCC